MPKPYHKEHLYKNEDDLYQKLSQIIEKGLPSEFRKGELRKYFRRYDWKVVGPLYDNLFERLKDNS